MSNVRIISDQKGTYEASSWQHGGFSHYNRLAFDAYSHSVEVDFDLSFLLPTLK